MTDSGRPHPFSGKEPEVSPVPERRFRFTRKFLYVSLLISMIFIGAAAAISFQAVSNIARLGFTAACADQKICVWIGNESGNMTYVTYTVKLISVVFSYNNYISTSFADIPKNVSVTVSSLNSTVSTIPVSLFSWVTGPFDMNPNLILSYNFAVSMVSTFSPPGTIGRYTVVVSVID